MERTEFLHNMWYVAMWSASLTPDRVIARTIVDIPIVFWRTADGRPGALLDRCAHRAAPLSMGAVRGDGIQCRYHGLHYDASGKCIFNPHPNGAVPASMRVRAFELVERYSLLWIWIGDAEPAPETIPDYSVIDQAPESQVSKRDYLLMKANIELITDNLLDLSHASFLHEGVLGNEQMVDAKTEIEQTGNRVRVSRFFRDVPVPGLFDLMFRRDGANVDHWTSIRWDPPGCLMNDVGVCAPDAERSRGTGLFGIHLLTPETMTTTHYHFCAVRQNAGAGQHDEAVQQQISSLRHIAFEEQDRAIIEAQQRNITLAGETWKPTLLGVDAGAVRHHRILTKLRNRSNRVCLLSGESTLLPEAALDTKHVEVFVSDEVRLREMSDIADAADDFF